MIIMMVMMMVMMMMMMTMMMMMMLVMKMMMVMVMRGGGGATILAIVHFMRTMINDHHHYLDGGLNFHLTSRRTISIFIYSYILQILYNSEGIFGNIKWTFYKRLLRAEMSQIEGRIIKMLR